MKIIDVDNNSITVKIQKYTTIPTLSYYMERVSSLKFYTIDRGVSSDKYEAEIECYGREDYIDSIMTMLMNQRNVNIGQPLTLSEFADNKGEAIFGDNVDYTTDINCIVIGTPIKKNTSLNVFSLIFSVRALGLSFEGTAAFPTAMKCIWKGWKGGPTEWGRWVNETYFNDNFVSIVNNDDKKFIAKFIATIEQSKQISELYRTIRGGSTIISASDIGVMEPFGLPTASTYTVVITDLKITPFSPIYREINIELTEVGRLL